MTCIDAGIKLDWTDLYFDTIHQSLQGIHNECMLATLEDLSEMSGLISIGVVYLVSGAWTVISSSRSNHGKARDRILKNVDNSTWKSFRFVSQCNKYRSHEQLQTAKCSTHDPFNLRILPVIETFLPPHHQNS